MQATNVYSQLRDFRNQLSEVTEARNTTSAAQNMRRSSGNIDQADSGIHTSASITDWQWTASCRVRSDGFWTTYVYENADGRCMQHESAM
jgi:hypothetical protein